MKTLKEEIEKLVEQILKGSLKAPVTGNFHPAFVVGIGGTGMKAVRFLKKYLQRHEKNQVRVFGIDSDNVENTKFADQLPPLLHDGTPDSELSIADAIAAINSLDRASAGTKGDLHLLDFLPTSNGDDDAIHQEVRDKITAQKGAGQFRRAGKLLFVSNVESGAKIGTKLEKIQDEIAQLPKTSIQSRITQRQEPGVRIYVVCSIAGGQGAGALIECLGLLRKHFHGPEDQIIAVCLLSGRLIDKELHDPVKEKPITRSNALGTIRELQAFLLGKLPKHKFAFGGKTGHSLGTHALANKVFLIDHKTMKGQRPVDHLDLCRAIGFFLYSYLGSGLGAHKEVGEINAPREKTGTEETPEIFNSFGVAALEYPVEAIAEYGLRVSYQRWLALFRAAGFDKKPIETAVDQFLTEANRRTSEELRSSFLPEMPELNFFPTKAQERQLIRKWDAEFFAAINRARTNHPTDLARYDGEIQERVANSIAELQAKIRLGLVEKLRGGIPCAQHFLKMLGDRLTTLAQEDAQEARSRPNEIKLADDDLKHHFWIDAIPTPLDSSWKLEHVHKFRKFLRLKVAERLDVYTAKAISNAQSAVKRFETDLSEMAKAAESFAAENETALEKLKTTTPDSCFIQSFVPHEELPQWMEAKLIDIPMNLDFPSLAEDELLSKPLESVVDGYKRLISGLDLIHELRKRPELLKECIVSLEMASSPLMSLVGSAPVEDLQFFKFVAGAVRSADEVVGKFTTTGHSGVKAIGTSDPHRLICLQSIQGFGAAHWTGFDEAQKHYREREWRSHSLTETDDLAPFTALTEDRAQALRNMGLALAFDFVHVRGSNYYRNLYINPIDDKSMLFISYTADPSAGACELIKHHLVEMPSPSTAAPQRAGPHFLANKLEDAIERIQSAAESDFTNLVLETIDDLKARVGMATLAPLVQGYASGPLDAQIHLAAPTSPRYSILREIQMALNGYVQQLR